MTTNPFAVGDRVIHVTSGQPARVTLIGRGGDANAVRIMVDGAMLPIDTRACFLQRQPAAWGSDVLRLPALDKAVSASIHRELDVDLAALTDGPAS